MRIVMEYGTGDGYTYGCTLTVPVIAESCEQALEDFEALVNGSAEEFSFCNEVYYAGDFKGKNSLPDFYTVDEWFAYQESI